MVKTSVRIQGGTELIKAMSELSPRVSKNVMRDALHSAAEPMRRDMSRLAPREPGAPDLAANIVISNGKADGVSTKESAAVAVGPAQGFFYGFYQEFGTAHHGAQPFVRPAFDGGVLRAIADISRAMWMVLSSRGISRSVTQTTTVQSDGSLL